MDMKKVRIRKCVRKRVIARLDYDMICFINVTVNLKPCRFVVDFLGAFLGQSAQAAAKACTRGLLAAWPGTTLISRFAFIIKSIPLILTQLRSIPRVTPVSELVYPRPSANLQRAASAL